MGASRPIVLPDAIFSDGTSTYTLSELPPGLTFFPTFTGSGGGSVISGVPTNAPARVLLTYTATDSASPMPNTARQTFTLTIHPVLALPEISDQTFIMNAVVDFTLPAVTGGLPGRADSLVYSLNGSLPDGLTFDSTTRELFGTPTTPNVPDGVMLTYTATDTPAANTFSVTFTLTVNADPTDPDSQTQMVSEVILPEVASAIVGNVTGAIAGRLDQVAAGLPGGCLTLGGQDTLAGALTTHGEAMTAGNGNRDLKNLLAGSGFVLPLNAADADAAPAESAVLLKGKVSF